MPDRKAWTQHEDNVLRTLKERGQKKWSVIARKMSEQFAIHGRSGKQCRDRFHNHLDSGIVTGQWTLEEQHILQNLQETVGNKWALIAQSLKGRSDNCVKNHFYSKLRKTVRRINKIIQEQFKKEYKQIKLNLLYKIIETTEDRFKDNSKSQSELINKSINIRNMLLKFQHTKIQETVNIEQARSIIEQINSFENSLKRANRRTKEHKTSTETNYSEIKQQKSHHKKENEEEPFYVIFKRVCEQIMLKQK